MAAITQAFPISILYFIVIAFCALWSALFLQGKFAPTLKISSAVEWLKDGWVRVSISVENVGFVRCNIEKTLYQIAISDAQTDGSTLPTVVHGEWIDFTTADQIFKSTTHINPKEIISCDRIYSVGITCKLLHIGTQVVIKNPWYIHILGPKARTTRQTSTGYACNPCTVYCESESLRTDGVEARRDG